MAHWMINCKEYTTLVSRQMDRRLSLSDKIAVRLHQLVCPPCRLIKDQYSIMRQACRWVPGDQNERGTCRDELPGEICERIKSAINNLPKQTS